MIRVGLDTCILVDSIIKRKTDYEEFFLELFNLHKNRFITLQLSLPVQFELYAIMKAGRLKRRNIAGDYESYYYTHKEILRFFLRYEGLFKIDFIKELEEKYTFLPGENLSGIPLYKDDFYQFILEEFDWEDWGLRNIEQNARKTKNFLHIPDKYDYPIMAAAIKDNYHVLITDNLGHFSQPLGTCLVLNWENAKKLDFFDDYFDLMLESEDAY